MRTDRLFQKIHEATQRDSGLAHLAVGALLLMTVIYASTIV